MYKLAGEKYKDDVIKIWKYCFSDTDDYVTHYFDKKYNGDRVVIYTKNKTEKCDAQSKTSQNEEPIQKNDMAVAAISLNDHNISIGKNVIRCPYVVGVSTLPEARGGGIMKNLMNDILKRMYEDKNPISILMPIDFRLYTKFGYTNCYDMMNVSLDIFDLKKFKLRGEFCKAEKNSVSDLLQIYRSSMKKYNGYSLRDDVYYNDFIEEMSIENGYIYINYENNIPTGYIAYTITDNVMYIREIYSTNIRSYKSLLKFIFNHNTQVKKVNILTVIDDVLMDILDNPKDAKFEIKPFMMARIINLEELTKQLKLETDLDEEILVSIIDDNIENNNGIYRIYSQNNLLSITKVDNVKQDLDCMDLISIEELTKVIMGYKTVEEIDYMREENFKNPKLLKKAFERLKSVNHINEYV